jgi:hypothetical protein
MAHSFDASMPTPSPESSRPAGGTRYHREQFPPAPRSVRIVRLSTDAADVVGLSVAEPVTKQSPGCVLAGRPVIVWLAVAALCVAAVLAWAVLRTAWN